MIRAAREDELALLPAIELSADRLLVEHGMGVTAHPAPAGQWRPALEAGLLWVVDEGSGPIAFLAAHLHEDVFFVAELDVAHEHQGRGLGRRLMRHAIETARSGGKAWVGLTTARTPPWNAPFYETLGFAIADDPPPWLARLLAIEAANGQQDRCGMLLSLAD